MRLRLSGAALLLAAALPFRPALADSAMSNVGKVGALTTGAAVYQHVCQGCHMPGGKGAEGSGARFPALAGNAKLASPGYPVYVVLNGYGAMPWFSGTLSDKQVADVVNYIRTQFGNHYTGTVTPQDVAAQDPHLISEGD